MLFSDLHTHTVFSHGKGTIEENFNRANEIGLAQLGISDHGLGHLMFGVKKKNIAVMRQEVERLNAKGKPTRVYLGIEANLTDFDGNIDLTWEEVKLFDYVIAGYHKASAPSDFGSFFSYNLGGIFRDLVKAKPDEKFTQAYIKAIKSGKIDIISHLNLGVRTYVKEVGKAARDYGVMIELNGKGVAMTDEELAELNNLGVTFIINSDAHTPDRVGDVGKPLAAAERAGIPESRIVNLCGPVDMEFFASRKSTSVTKK